MTPTPGSGPNAAAREHALRVAHLVADWLPYSQNWIHAQVIDATFVSPSVIAERVLDANRFPAPGLREIGPSRVMFGAFASRGFARAATLALAASDARVAHAHFGPVGWRWLPFARELRIPLVTSFYGYDMSRLPASRPIWRERYRELFAHGERFLCEGPAMAKALVALGCPAAKLVIRPLGVDVSRFAPRERAREPGAPLRVIAVGRFVAKKGLPDAIAATVMAARRIPVELTVVGAPEATAASAREGLRVLAAALRAGGRVRLAGRWSHDELARRAGEFDVVLQPSRHTTDGDSEGGAPVILAELCASGMPAVATWHADIPEVVRDGETGLLAAEGDVAAIAGHLVRLFVDPAWRARLGANAAAHARARFDRDRAGAALGAVYRDVAGASTRR